MHQTPRDSVRDHPTVADADFDMTGLMLRDGAPIPTVDPQLPDCLTHVWVASTWATGNGYRWSRQCGWEEFNKSTPVSTI